MTVLFEGVFQFCYSLERVEFLGLAQVMCENVFAECADGLTLYYHTSFKDSLVANGASFCCGNPICPILDILGDLDSDGTASFNDVSRLCFQLPDDVQISALEDYNCNGTTDFSDVLCMFFHCRAEH